MNALPQGAKAPDPLADMTQARWDALTQAQREAARDLPGLSPQLAPLKGWRVEVVRTDGTRARFIVGQSTGWRPCSLEIHNRRCHSGPEADKHYQSVTPLYRVRP